MIGWVLEESPENGRIGAHGLNWKNFVWSYIRNFSFIECLKKLKRVHQKGSEFRLNRGFSKSTGLRVALVKGLCKYKFDRRLASASFRWFALKIFSFLIENYFSHLSFLASISLWYILAALFKYNHVTSKIKGTVIEITIWNSFFILCIWSVLRLKAR